MAGDIIVTLKLLEKVPQIEKMIKREMAKKLTMALKRNLSKLKREINDEVNEWMKESPELLAVAYGPLKGDFGIPKGQSVTEANKILDAIWRSVQVDFKPLDKDLRGGIIIRIQPSEMGNILSAVSPVKTEKGENLDWISWLLKRGDDIVVADYHVVPGNHGRSGDAVMREGGFFRVRPEYSGTLADNFITRALKGREKQILRIIARQFNVTF